MYKEAWQKILNSSKIMLICHERPDGDALGSVLALYEVLKNLNKKVYLFNASKKMPSHLSFLPNFNKIKNAICEDFDLAIFCDCASQERAKISLPKEKIINLDHHKSNTNFGSINIVKPNMPSASLVVYKMLKKNGVLLNESIATCLYVGFLEDTNFFMYGNISPKIYKLIASLCENGIDIKTLHQKLKMSVPLSIARLTQRIYEKFHLINEGKFAWIFLDSDDLKSTGCEYEDIKRVSSILLQLVSVEVSVIFVKKPDGKIKASLRSKSDNDVDKMAAIFGGGGHKNSAGFECDDQNIEEIVKKLIG